MTMMMVMVMVIMMMTTVVIMFLNYNRQLRILEQEKVEVTDDQEDSKHRQIQSNNMRDPRISRRTRCGTSSHY